jgi:Domain of unknown function (DUF4430)
MRPARPLLAAAAALAVVAAAGCGFGAGPSSEGEATIRVTRDYGSELMVDASVSDPAESDTVIRALDREAEITTRYGGGFVQSIEGLSGGTEDGRAFDWFFYVNGIESPIGAADVPLKGDDRIWWDYHDWTDVMRVPAVVGSWPEPLAQAASGEDRMPVRVECAAREPTCDDVVEHLATEGVAAGVKDFGQADEDGREEMRVLVGPWGELRRDATAGLLDAGADRSGVFARFERSGSGWALSVLGPDARAASRLQRHAGLVAALREGEDPPTVLVAGADEAGVEAAVELLEPDELRDRYALAVGPDGEVPAPLVAGESP